MQCWISGVSISEGTLASVTCLMPVSVPGSAAAMAAAGYTTTCRNDSHRQSRWKRSGTMALFNTEAVPRALAAESLGLRAETVGQPADPGGLFGGRIRLS